MKKIALIIYPEFSIQEVSMLMYMFRWFYDVKTVTFSSTHEIVYSEEGVGIYPERTFDEFEKDAYHCIILSGCSDLREVIHDKKLFIFLHSFVDDHEFVIGAICSAPILLSMAGLLKNKKFTNSVFYELNTSFHAIDDQHIVYAPVVVDQNIVTAVGDAFREFAIQIARSVGFSCRDEAMLGISSNWKADDFIHHLPEEELEKFMKEELAMFEQSYEELKPLM